MDNLEYEKIIKCFESSNLEELEISYRDFQIKCRKTNTTIHSPTQKDAIDNIPTENIAENKASTETKVEGSIKIIKSPIVGTFYRAPSPDAKVFIEEGETAKKGQTLCILEAMKMMNELESETECKIVEILVNSGDLVEFDQPLFKVEVL
ncbi:MAG: acetyl-CoA carboxylase biotin carboxyl carrier protein [Pleomorphochaeta sp.]